MGIDLLTGRFLAAPGGCIVGRRANAGEYAGRRVQFAAKTPYLQTDRQYCRILPALLPNAAEVKSGFAGDDRRAGPIAR